MLKRIAGPFATVFMAAGVSIALAADLKVSQWQPHDFSFSFSGGQGNPFQVPFAAELSGPGGAKLKMSGFYDGDGTWKVRISPTALGEWSLVTQSSVPELNGQRASFTCIPNSLPHARGTLRVDPNHPYQFVFEDGSHPFEMGYECDWLWALDANDPRMTITKKFLDKIAANQFNFIVLNAFAQDTSWRKGKTGDDDYGPPPLYPWEGTNEQPDFTRFNLAYWRHYDQLMDALNERGIVAHLLVKVYNKQVHWPANGSPEDDQYYRWLIARYAAYPNLIWDLAKEAQYEKNVDYKLGRFRFIRENDPYHRLLTIHDDKAVYDRGAYDTVADFRSDQQHTQWRETMLAHRKQKKWPVINTEFGYEHGPNGLNDKTYSHAQDPEEVCRRAWEVSVAGGFTTYYYTYTAWDIIRPEDNPPGYAYFKNLARFFRGTAFWTLNPVEGVASAGACLANPGKEYIVLLNPAATFTLKVDGATAPLPIEWYQPFTGARMSGQSINDGVISLTPPAEWGTGLVALHVGSAVPPQ